jgi:peptidoglycan/xylan/chitin deacetylase (PgdA/CDA1 family)
LPSSARTAAFGYHEVTTDPATTGFQRPGAAPYRLTPDGFDAHLAAFAAGPIAPERVTDVDLAAGGSHLFLTFDDGGRSALDAAELLARRGWRGHFFIVTGLLGERTFLEAAGVRALHDAGHVIGTHSHTHPAIFREQPFDRMVEEWRVSRDRLEQIVGEPCLSASVPGGDLSAAVLRSAATAGLRWLFTSEPWVAPRRQGDCWVLGRAMVKVSTSPQTAGDLARFRGWGRALLVRRIKNAARAVAPPLYRMLVGRRVRPYDVTGPS